MIGFRLDWSYISIATVFAKPRVAPTSRILRSFGGHDLQKEPGLPIVDARSPNARDRGHPYRVVVSRSPSARNLTPRTWTFPWGPRDRGHPVPWDGLRNSWGGAVSNSMGDVNTDASIESVFVRGIVWLCGIVCLDGCGYAECGAGAGWRI